MILDAKQTTVAYRCPYCGCTVLSMVGVFALSGDFLRLRCACEKSEMTIQYMKDNKVRLSVPCITCPTPHTYTVDKSMFFNRENVFAIPCSYTGLDVCFIGNKDGVCEAAKNADLELAALMEEAGLDDITKLYDAEDDLPEYDPQVNDVVRYMITELNEEGKIKCNCQNNALARYDFAIKDGELTVFCEECDAEFKMPMTGAGAARDMVDLDELVLR